jgi:hypothetical protein
MATILIIFSIIASTNLALLFTPELSFQLKIILLTIITLGLISLGKVLNSSKSEDTLEKINLIKSKQN